jgi:hypothetical protein
MATFLLVFALELLTSAFGWQLHLVIVLLVFLDENFRQEEIYLRVYCCSLKDVLITYFHLLKLQSLIPSS